MDLEQKWIRAVQEHGSRPAAERLIERYYDEIFRFTYRQTGNKEDAMDLTQSIFLAVLRAIPAYDRKRSAFRTWLYRIAANKVIDQRRRPRYEIAKNSGEASLLEAVAAVLPVYV